MNITALCNLIQESFRSGNYPLLSEIEKKMASSVKIINKSGSEDLKGESITIETRINEFFVLNNYIPTITHLPGIIEMDSLDSFRMLCRRVERSSGSDMGHLSIKTLKDN